MSPVGNNDRAFCFQTHCPGFETETRRYVMKFLLIVLAIHLAAEVMTGKRKDGNKNDKGATGKTVHPAEYDLR